MLVSFQVMEKNILLLVVNMCEEIQRKPVVCLQFFLWNILDLLRYVPVGRYDVLIGGRSFI